MVHKDSEDDLSNYSHEKAEDQLTMFDACTIMIARIVALGFEHFPANIEGVWPWIPGFLALYFILNIISTYLVLKLKCMYPKTK
jgi:hypothetical protein